VPIDGPGALHLSRERMEIIIPYLLHTPFCISTTEIDFLAGRAAPEASPYKGRVDLICRIYLNFYAFFN
jgi:hypothetical protein